MRSLALNVGDNPIDVIVTAQDGTTTKTYTITVTRAPSSDATLGGFTLSDGTASPAFNATTTSYTASVAYATSSLTVTPTSGDGLSTIQVRVNGGALSTVASGTASGSLALNVGDNPIDVVVTAQDGTTTKTYTVTVTRAPSSDATLGGFVLSGTTASPTFSATTFSYTANVPNATTNITVTPTSGDGLSTIQVRVNGGALSTVASGAESGSLALNVGDNPIDVIVTAQDGTTTKTYTITVTRAPSANANLANLTISTGTFSPAFATGTLSYAVTVANSVTSMTFTPTVQEANATVTVNGLATGSGSASAPVALNAGVNAIPVVVTAQDGTTILSYTVDVTRSQVVVADQADIGLANDLLINALNVTGTAVGTKVYDVVTGPLHGTVEIDVNGNYSYKPVTDYVGADSFTYSVTDDTGLVGSATVEIAIVLRPPHWSWEGGSNLPKQKGTFPALVGDNGTPGARGNMASWSDGAGHLYIFGGTGYGVGTAAGALNDFWRCDLATQTWTWKGGSNAINGVATYGTKGTAAPGNIPGARAGASTWVDASGNLWMFGGVSSTGPLNDLWKYDGANWTWVSGDNTVKHLGDYGALGTPSATTRPGARSGAASWIDSSGKLYLFGGNGMTDIGTAIALMNDLWTFDPANGTWTWLSGSKTAKAVGVYGTKGIASAANVPGARVDATATVGRDGMAYVFGGSNNNDLWKYNPNTNAWTWIAGSNKAAAKGVYVKRGIPDSVSEPASRSGARAWTGLDGQLYLFGGLGPRDDVWSFNTSSNQWTWVKGSNVASAAANYGTQHLGEEPNTPGARQQSAIALDANGDVWNFGGLNGANNFNDLFKLDVPAVLTVDTLAATSVTGTTARLNATVNPNEVATSVHFRYGTLLDMSDAITTTDSAVAPGNLPVAANANVGVLSAGTTYYYQAVASNAFGTRMGSVRSFTTEGAAPASTVQFASISSNVGEKGVVATVTLTLSTPATSAIVVPITVSSTNATVYSLANKLTADYMAPAASVHFAAGQAAATFAISIVDNAVAESTENLVLDLGTLPVGVSAGSIPSHTLNIIDDDQPVSIITAPVDQFIALKDTLNLSVAASGSGPIAYQWKKNGAKVAGATSATYTLHNATTAAAGTYVCDMTNPLGVKSTDAVKVFVVDAASKIVTLATGKPASFSVAATGPAGTVFHYQWKQDVTTDVGTDSKTFAIPAVAPGNAGTYVCTVSTTGTAGIVSRTGGSNVLRVSSTPLVYPVNAYLGLVERDVNVGGNRGARVDLTTTAVGGFTAKLTTDGLTASAITSTMVPTLSGSTLASARGTALFVRTGKPTLRLDFVIDITANTLSGTLTDVNTLASKPLNGFRNVWTAKAPTQATNYEKAYTFALEIPAELNGDLDVPQGNGYGAFTVGLDGKLTCAGSTADGLAYTSAGFVGPSGQVMIYSAFATPGGSLLGTGSIGVAADLQNNTFGGTLSWNRAPEAATSKSVTYRAGFAPMNLTIVGGKYKAQELGGVVAGLSNSLNDAKLIFSEGGLSAADLDGSDSDTLADTFLFSIRNLTATATKKTLVQTITLPLATDTVNNYNKVTFTLAASPAGLYNGTFTIPNAKPTLVRKATFKGIIVWNGSNHVAPGYFLLAQPPQSGQTITTSNILSGQVMLLPNVVP